MTKMIKKNFDTPDDKMQPSGNISVKVVELNGNKFHQVTAKPGWKWSIDLKPVLKTDSCPMNHLLYMISGRMVVKMDDGQELEFGPGDLAAIPPGHDGWGIGDDPTVWLEIPQ